MNFIKKNTLLFILIISIGVIILLIWFTLKPRPTQSISETPEKWHYMVAKQKPINIYYRASGTIQPDTESNLASQITAKVEQVFVHVGDRVKKNQILLELDHRDALTQLAQAHQNVLSTQAHFELAKVNLARIKKLLKPGYVTQSDYDQSDTQFLEARAALETAKKTLDQAKIALSYCTIRAPSDAVVLDRSIDPGDQASPGEILLKLQTSEQLQLEINIPEILVNKISKQQSVLITIPNLQSAITGTIAEIEPNIDPNTRTFLTKITIPNNQKIFPGMYGYAQIPIGIESMITLPKKTIIQSGQLTLVRILGHQSPELAFVTLGKTMGQQVEILSGINQGDKIIIDNAYDK